MRPRMLLGGMALAAAIAGPAQAADDVKIGFITKFPVPFFATMEDAAKAYAEANPGVEIIFGQGTSATDIEGQIALIESMVTQGVQGIAVTPVDPTVAPALDKAIEAGVKVVLMDNNIPDWDGRTALATTDNYAAGKIAGEYLKSVLKDGDTLGILEGVPGVPSLDDRVNGMLEGLQGVDVDIVGRGATNCTEELGINVAEDLLTANPDLKAIYSACGPPAAGAARAIENAGIANDAIVLVGFDFCCGEAEALDGRNRRRHGGAVPRQDGRTRRRCARQGHPRRAGRVADRLGRRPGHEGQHGGLPVGDRRGRRCAGPPPPTRSAPTPATGSESRAARRRPCLLETGPLAAGAATRPAARSRAGAGSSAPGRHLRHRLPHLRGQASLPAISSGDGPRARRGGRSGPARMRVSRPARSASSIPISPAATASPAAQASRIAASTCPCSAFTRTAAWPGCCACRRPISFPRKA